MPTAVITAGAKLLVGAGLGVKAAFAVSTFVVTQTAISAASFAANKVFGKRAGASASLQERQASVINIQLGEVPREFVAGTTTTGGSLVDAFSYGGQHGTDTFAQCIALADHEISRILGYYVDDQYVAWTGNGTQPGFNGKLSILFQNATEDGHAPPTIALSNGWSASDVGRGVARVWVFATVDDQVWSQGFPRFRWVLEGGKVYDPRRDAALGYTGPDPCDFDDPTTWVVSQNPILLDYAYRRGIYVAGRHQQAGQLLIGRGLSALEAPPEAIIAAANVCDEVLGPTSLRYTAAGVIRADQPFVEVAEMFAAACAGVIVQREGGVEIEPGQAKAAVVTITDDDLIVGEAVSFSEFLPDTEGGRVNTVVPRYVSPGQLWKDHAGPVRRAQGDITADGGPREATLALALVTDADQADRSAEIARRLYRLERRATVVLPPRFAYLEEGDWIAWTSARFHKGSTVRYRIESWSMGEDWRMRLTLREIAASVFGEADPIPDQAIPAPPPVPADALTLANVTIEAISLAGEASTLPAVRFGWAVPVDPAVLAIRAEIRISGETEISTARTEAVGDGVLVVTNGVAPGQSLQGRLIPIGHPTRPIAASPWVTISTVDAVAVIAPDVRADLDAAIAAAEAEAAAAQAEAASALAGLAAEITRATSAEGTISASVAALSGTVNSNFTTLSNADAGLAAQIATTNSTLSGFTASTNSTLASLAAADAALSSRTTTVEAQVALRPNLCPNGGLENGLAGLVSSAPMVVADNVAFGRVVLLNTSASGSYSIDWPSFLVFPGFSYTVSGDVQLFAAAGAAYFDLIFLNSVGGVVFDGPQSPVGVGDFSDAPSRRQQLAASAVAPAGAVRAYARCVFEGVVNPASMSARRVKVEQGSLPATAYTPEGGVNQLSARVSTSEGAITSLQGRTQAWWQNQTQAGESATLIRAQSDAAAGSSIMMVADKLGIATSVGGVVKELARFEANKIRFGTDVAISGDLLVDGAITNAKISSSAVTRVNPVVVNTPQVIPPGSARTVIIEADILDSDLRGGTFVAQLDATVRMRGNNFRKLFAEFQHYRTLPGSSIPIWVSMFVERTIDVADIDDRYIGPVSLSTGAPFVAVPGLIQKVRAQLWTDMSTGRTPVANSCVYAALTVTTLKA